MWVYIYVCGYVYMGRGWLTYPPVNGASVCLSVSMCVCVDVSSPESVPSEGISELRPRSGEPPLCEERCSASGCQGLS